MKDKVTQMTDTEDNLDTMNMLDVVRKCSKILDREPLENHSTAIAMLNSMLQRRGIKAQQKLQTDQEDRQRAAQFGLVKQ